MMEPNSAIENIFVELTKKPMARNEVGKILNDPKEFPTELIGNLALMTALKYWNGEINYKDGECIMSNLFTFWATSPDHVDSYAFSDTAWECFEAFDAGTYYRTNDDRKIDPEQKYTKPLIEALLKKRKRKRSSSHLTTFRSDF